MVLFVKLSVLLLPVSVAAVMSGVLVGVAGAAAMSKLTVVVPVFPAGSVILTTAVCVDGAL